MAASSAACFAAVWAVFRGETSTLLSDTGSPMRRGAYGEEPLRRDDFPCLACANNDLMTFFESPAATPAGVLPQSSTASSERKGGEGG